MGIAIGAGVAAAGAFSYFGSQNAANAAGSAAQAQSDAANANRSLIMGQAAQFGSSAEALAQSTPQELAVLGQSYQAQSAQLQQQQQLMSSVDPALMEASKQALGILRGGTAQMNNPLMAQRNSQRAQLVNSLRSQYGPGAESSSIGQKQLQQFDMQSDSMFQQNQQNSLSQLMGIAGDNSFNQGLQMSSNGLQQVGQGYSSLQQRKLNTTLQNQATTLGALSGTSQSIIGSAGAPYVSAGLQGQAQSALGNSFMQSGTQLGSAYLFGSRGGAPASNPTAGMQGSQEGGYFGSGNPYAAQSGSSQGGVSGVNPSLYDNYGGQ